MYIIISLNFIYSILKIDFVLKRIVLNKITMDPNVFTLFNRDQIQKIGKKLTTQLLNHGTRVKSKFTQFIMLPCDTNSSVNHYLIDVYNIFVSEDKWNEYMNKFIHLNQTKIVSTNFEYKNMKLIRFNDETGKSICEKHVSHEQILGKDCLNLLLEVNNVDVSQFSCRDDIRHGEVIEYRISVAEKAPIYLSFIHDKSINKFYYKLWFEIKEDIDDVLDSFLE